MGKCMTWLKLFHDDDDIVEIRSIDPKPTISGYFKANSENIQRELARFPGRTFYQTMNHIDCGCYSRAQHEKLMQYPKETTSDRDIIGFRWLLIDCDPVRPAGVSSTNEEKLQAKRVAASVRKYLLDRGFSEPIVADSGNGYHLLFRIQIILERKETIADFLKVMDMWFSTDAVQIDTAVYNPARITKLYGTMATKGANTEERPHRQSAIVLIPEKIEITPLDLIEQIAAEREHMIPSDSGSSRRSGTPFDMDSFLAEHGVSVARKMSSSGFTKYVLSECPFDANHKAPDSAVFVGSDGKLGFKCFHNSCCDYSWHDFRSKVDPAAYTTSAFAPNKHVTFQRLSPGVVRQPSDTCTIGEVIPFDQVPPNTQPVQPTVLAEPAMLDIADIEDYDRSKTVVIKSRFMKLDNLIGGFNKGELSIWSGSNSSGKSTLVSQLGLEAVHQGYKVALFSGELPPKMVKYWLFLQAAGKDRVEEDPLSPNHYKLKSEEDKKRLNEMMRGKLKIYNNNYGTMWEQVIEIVVAWVKEQNADVIIIDNLMALDINGTTEEKYEAQKKIVTRLSLIAKQLSIHVHFICHPRKTEGFLRKNDICGSSDLGNTADNIFMVHRVNTDFTLNIKQVYPKLAIPNGAGNAIEIMKNRDLGVVDEVIFLFFDPTCKTLSDVKGGRPVFGWSEGFTQIDMTDDPDFPFNGE